MEGDLHRFPWHHAGGQHNARPAIKNITALHGLAVYENIGLVSPPAQRQTGGQAVKGVAVEVGGPGKSLVQL